MNLILSFMIQIICIRLGSLLVFMNVSPGSVIQFQVKNLDMEQIMLECSLKIIGKPKN